MKKWIIFSTLMLLMFSTLVFAQGLKEQLLEIIAKNSSMRAFITQGGVIRIPTLKKVGRLTTDKGIIIESGLIFYNLDEMYLCQDSSKVSFIFHNEGFISAPIVRITAANIGTFYPGQIFANTVYVNDEKRNDLIKGTPLSAEDFHELEDKIARQKSWFSDASSYTSSVASKSIAMPNSSPLALRGQIMSDPSLAKMHASLEQEVLSDLSFVDDYAKFVSGNKEKETNLPVIRIRVHNNNPTNILACYVYDKISKKLLIRKQVSPKHSLDLDVREGDSISFYAAQFKPAGGYEKGDLKKFSRKIDAGWKAALGASVGIGLNEGTESSVSGDLIGVSDRDLYFYGIVGILPMGYVGLT